jgi:peptidoglycan hydrolase CwlO-like protein
MVTIILAIALLLALCGLGLEVGITSWSIRRASRYQRREAAAEHTTERAVNERQDLAKRLESLDDYASKISWLLNFLYNRYDKFSDIETEVQGGLKEITGDTPLGEADARYKDLKKALKIIRVTVRASERMEDLMNSITSQLSQIMEDFRDEEDEEKKPESSESEKPAEAESGDEKAPEPEAPKAPEVPEAGAPDAESPAS